MNYEKLATELGLKIEDVERGYFPVYDGEFGITIIQKIDELADSIAEKFKSDTEAGIQALRDGFKLFTVNHEDLAGWFILDSIENRQSLLDKGYSVELFSEARVRENIKRSIYRSEKNMIEDQMWKVVLRETGVSDDAGCDWFTIGDATYIGGIDWLVSEDKEIAELVNAINALNGRLEFINYTSEEIQD